MTRYSYKAWETIDRMIGDRKSWKTNRYYKSAEGDFYWYENQRGFFHAVKVERGTFNGKSIIAVVDYLLTANNMIKESARNYYDSMEEAMNAIAENLEA